MATDMDIDMDIDIDLDFAPEELIIPGATADDILSGQGNYREAAPNDTSDSNHLEPTPEKVHIRGLDNLTTKDIRLFASEYFPAHKPVHVQWIDDTSANLIYEDATIARDALQAFTNSDTASLSILQLVPSKAFPDHPDTNLEVRIAVTGDRKQSGARERSRFYLMNPEYDPAERRSRDGPRGGRSYRDREDGGYRSQRYNDRENRKRQHDDESAGFDVNLYDDDAAALAHRAARSNGRPNSSGSDSRERDNRRGRYGRSKNTPKELFPDEGQGNGRLRDRSASPERDREADSDIARDRRRDSAAIANRRKAQMIKEQLKKGSSTVELFPHKLGVQHRRSDAFDAADETAELFSKQMPVRFTDGAVDETDNSYATKIVREAEIARFNVRGAAKQSTSQGLSIKGSAPAVKELFPSHGNTGKELFGGKLEGRGLRRQRAGDLFD